MAILPTIYTDIRITTQQKGYDKIYYGRVMPRYAWYVLQQDATKLNIYGEKDENKGEPDFVRFAQDVPMRVILNPEGTVFKKYGIEYPRDAIVEHSTAVLAELGLYPKIGDRFDVVEPVGGAYPNPGVTEQYEIMWSSYESYNWNQKVPLRVIMAAMKTRRIRTA